MGLMIDLVDLVDLVDLSRREPEHDFLNILILLW